MARYLSSEWLDLAAEAINEAEAVQALAGPELVIQIDIGDISYHLRRDPRGITLVAGAADRALVVLRQSRAAAVDIASGRRNAQEAFVAGEVRLHGPADQLMTARPLMEAIELALAPVRAVTEF